jgi:hypothetical protein
VLRRLVAIAAAALLAPALARGAPATVHVFEAPARSAPRPDAPVLHVFPEGAPVSVAEVVEQGFRRIRLPDGGVGFVAEAEVRLAEVGAPPPLPTALAAHAPAAPAAPDLVARIYVKDLDHLAALVQADPDVGPKARRLERRRRTAMTTGVLGFGASLALTTAGFIRMNNAFDRAGASPTYDAPGNDGMGLVITGLAVSAITPIVMWAVLPKRHDLLDVVNGWNVRHPTEQFELGAGFGETHRGGRYHRY